MTQLNIYDFLDDPAESQIQQAHYESEQSHLHNLAAVIHGLLIKHPQLKELI